ncbi:hypothetical protein HZS_51 [Henneguya salminicola]|nr:hypothetical protein HZS_51 [Henneguya salminicola]
MFHVSSLLTSTFRWRCRLIICQFSLKNKKNKLLKNNDKNSSFQNVEAVEWLTLNLSDVSEIF